MTNMKNAPPPPCALVISGERDCPEAYNPLRHFD